MAVDEIRLSRMFKTTASHEEMSKPELVGKSAAALVLGVVPFLVTAVAMQVFKGFANLCSHSKLLLRPVVALPGALAAAVMFVSAKVFALSQTVVWGHFVKNPGGDGANTRLAQYGASDLPWQDFQSVIKVFFVPSKLQTNEWTMRDWSHLQI